MLPAAQIVRKAKRRESRRFRDGERLVSRLSGPVERMWIAVAERLKRDLPMRLIAEAVRVGSPTPVIAALPPDLGLKRRTVKVEVRKQQDFEAEIETSLLFAARASYLDEAGRLRLDIGEARDDFETWALRNPKTVAWAKREAATLVTQVADSTKDGIRRAITEAYEQGIPTGQAARMIRESIGLLPKQTQALARQQAAMRARDISPERIERASRMTVRRMLRERAEMIARTEMNAAQNRGRQASWQEAIETGDLPQSMRQVWDSGVEDPTCEICLGLHGQAVAVGASFQSAIAGQVEAPPAHPHCRCSVRLSSPEDTSPVPGAALRP